MKLRALLVSSALVTTVVACSGAEDTELFAPATAINGTSPSGGSGSASSSSGNTGSSPGSSGPGTPSSSGGGGTSSGGTSSGGTSSGGTSSGGTSSGGPNDAGPGNPPPGGTIFCGDNPPCANGTEICCISFPLLGGDPTFQCTTGGLLACLGAEKISCDDTSDCPANQICCGTFDQSATHGSTECKSASSCKPPLGGRAGILCDPSVAPDQCAPFGMACEESKSLPGYYTCRD